MIENLMIKFFKNDKKTITKPVEYYFIDKQSSLLFLQISFKTCIITRTKKHIEKKRHF